MQEPTQAQKWYLQCNTYTILDRLKRNERKAWHLSSSSLDIINGITTTNADDYIFFLPLCVPIVCRECRSWCAALADDYLLFINLAEHTITRNYVRDATRNCIKHTQRARARANKHTHTHAQWYHIILPPLGTIILNADDSACVCLCNQHKQKATINTDNCLAHFIRLFAAFFRFVKSSRVNVSIDGDREYTGHSMQSQDEL